MAILKPRCCVKVNDNRQGVWTFFSGQCLFQISYIEEFLQKKALEMFVCSYDWYGIFHTRQNLLWTSSKLSLVKTLLLYVCVCVYIYICICVYIYIYVYIVYTFMCGYIYLQFRKTAIKPWRVKFCIAVWHGITVITFTRHTHKYACCCSTWYSMEL